jgi:CheY-like chemotaxis protein
LLSDPGKKRAKSIEKSRSVSAASAVVVQNGGHLIFGNSGKGRSDFEILLPGVMDRVFGSPQKAAARAMNEVAILLVEDDSAMRQFVKTVLRRLGHQVVDAADGVQALEVLEAKTGFKPDMLVTDVVMPRMGGVELAKKLRASFPELRVLFISGYADQRSSTDQFEADSAFLKKPFEIGELISVAGNLLTD